MMSKCKSNLDAKVYIQGHPIKNNIPKQICYTMAPSVVHLMTNKQEHSVKQPFGKYGTTLKVLRRMANLCNVMLI